MNATARQSIRVENLVKRYADVAALDDVSLEIPSGSFLTLLGPSGSGKTTLLMTIAGFTRPDSGRVLLGPRDITPLPPERRNFGMVFQGYALFPHLSVAENIAFPLKLRGFGRAEIEAKVRFVLDIVQLSRLAARYPRQLSGGQQQRVALARAIVFEPEVLLLDEPLSALDKALRSDLQWELKTLHHRLGMTFIYVTHDQEEALSMSDDIAIVRDGRIVQKGDPATLYDRPQTHFVAGFLGKSNYLEGTLSQREGNTTLAVGDFALDLAEPPTSAVGSPILVAIRPEKIEVAQQPTAGRRNSIPGELAGWNYYGSNNYVRVNTALGLFHAQFPTWKSTLQLHERQKLWVEWDAEAGTVVQDDRKKPVPAASVAVAS